MFYLILKVEVEKQKKIVVTTLFSKALFAKQKKMKYFFWLFSHLILIFTLITISKYFTNKILQYFFYSYIRTIHSKYLVLYNVYMLKN